MSKNAVKSQKVRRKFIDKYNENKYTELKNYNSKFF